MNLDNTPQPTPTEQRKKRKRKMRQRHPTVYAVAFHSEWILLSNYSPEDYQCRFVWPELRKGISTHFLANVA
ncbi:MAG: hypothetical protein R3264_20360 [Anaerolineae bacterium]|nr:hypothetical protein [Anaerolineae bacterium]